MSFISDVIILLFTGADRKWGTLIVALVAVNILGQYECHNPLESVCLIYNMLWQCEHESTEMHPHTHSCCGSVFLHSEHSIR